MEDIIQKRCDIFRFRKGMKAKLYNQVATDNPEGMGHSAKGWDIVVEKLKSSGPEWALLNVRCARDTTREAVKAWSKADRENREKTGTGENETEEDEFLREISELWKERVEKEKEGKLAMSSKDQGLAIRRIATEGLKRRNPADDNELTVPTCSTSGEGQQDTSKAQEEGRHVVVHEGSEGRREEDRGGEVEGGRQEAGPSRAAAPNAKRKAGAGVAATKGDNTAANAAPATAATADEPVFTKIFKLIYMNFNTIQHFRFTELQSCFLPLPCLYICSFDLFAIIIEDFQTNLFTIQNNLYSLSSMFSPLLYLYICAFYLFHPN